MSEEEKRLEELLRSAQEPKKTPKNEADYDEMLEKAAAQTAARERQRKKTRILKRKQEIETKLAELENEVLEYKKARKAARKDPRDMLEIVARNKLLELGEQTRTLEQEKADLTQQEQALAAEEAAVYDAAQPEDAAYAEPAESEAAVYDIAEPAESDATVYDTAEPAEDNAAAYADADEARRAEALENIAFRRARLWETLEEDGVSEKSVSPTGATRLQDAVFNYTQELLEYGEDFETNRVDMEALEQALFDIKYRGHSGVADAQDTAHLKQDIEMVLYNLQKSANWEENVYDLANLDHLLSVAKANGIVFTPEELTPQPAIDLAYINEILEQNKADSAHDDAADSHAEPAASEPDEELLTDFEPLIAEQEPEDTAYAEPAGNEYDEYEAPAEAYSEPAENEYSEYEAPEEAYSEPAENEYDEYEEPAEAYAEPAGNEPVDIEINKKTGECVIRSGGYERTVWMDANAYKMRQMNKFVKELANLESIKPRVNEIDRKYLKNVDPTIYRAYQAFDEDNGTKMAESYAYTVLDKSIKYRTLSQQPNQEMEEYAERMGEITADIGWNKELKDKREKTTGTFGIKHLWSSIRANMKMRKQAKMGLAKIKDDRKVIVGLGIIGATALTAMGIGSTVLSTSGSNGKVHTTSGNVENQQAATPINIDAIKNFEKYLDEQEAAGADKNAAIQQKDKSKKQGADTRVKMPILNTIESFAKTVQKKKNAAAQKSEAQKQVKNTVNTAENSKSSNIIYPGDVVTIGENALLYRDSGMQTAVDSVMANETWGVNKIGFIKENGEAVTTANRSLEEVLQEAAMEGKEVSAQLDEVVEIGGRMCVKAIGGGAQQYIYRDADGKTKISSGFEFQGDVETGKGWTPLKNLSRKVVTKSSQYAENTYQTAVPNQQEQDLER